MSKIPVSPQTLIYPMPALLIGTNVDNKPNFMTVAWGGVANGEPPMISIAIRSQRHTHKGIRQNMAFSVNIPSTELVRETDYCGIVSGWKVDKSEVFESFYGTLGTAPMIVECPVNLECKVVKNFDVHPCEVFVGEVVETYVGKQYLTEGDRHKYPDIGKINPIILSPDNKYLFFISGKTGNDDYYWVSSKILKPLSPPLITLNIQEPYHESS